MSGRYALMLGRLRDELDNGPDAARTLTGACPLCDGDQTWERVLELRFYPEGNGYQVECETCPLAVEVTL